MIARLGLTLVAVGLSLAPPAAASPVDLFGFGARGGAMASTIASTAEGFAAVYYNPGALAFEKRPSFGFGFQSATFDLSIDGVDEDTRAAPALVFGFTVPIPFGGVLRERLTLALGFVIPQSSVLIADIPAPADPHFVLVENRAQTVSIQAALGIRLADWLGIGVGFLALAELDGGIDVSPNDAGLLGSTLRSELVASFALVVGALVRPTDWLSVALTYRNESIGSFIYPITADLGDDFPIPIPLLDVQGTAQYDPAQVTLEVSGSPTDWLTVAVAGTWKQWSAFINPIVYTAVPDAFPAQPPAEFDDSFVIRVGAEATAAVAEEWTLQPRLGLAFEPTPVPEQTGFHNYLDNDRLLVATGLGVRWNRLRLDLMAQVHVLFERESAKDDAQLLVHYDDAADSPGYPSVSHSGLIWMWGIEIGLEIDR